MKAPALSTAVGNVGSTSVGTVETSPSPGSLNGSLKPNTTNRSNNAEPDSNWQQEMLMERLRTRTAALRPLQDSSKAMRQCILVRPIASLLHIKIRDNCKIE